MPRRAVVIVLAVLILGAALAGVQYWRWYYSPRYALQQMVLALKTKDMNNFFKYLDLKEIFNNFLKASSKELDAPEDPEADEWTRFSQRLGRKFARQFLPKLFEAFEKQIREVMTTYLANLDNSQILAVGAAVTVAKIDVKGDVAQVTLHDPKTREPLRFQMRRKPGGIWRIESVTYEDFKKFIKREFQG
jgi:hypothetical protein